MPKYTAYASPAVSQVRGRVPVESGWPNGGMVTREMDDRNWSVQQFTGYPTSTVARGQWNRGILYRTNSPAFRPALPPLMYDPTDASTWANPRR